MTAGGKVLGNIHNLKSLRKAWEAGKARPESERAPGAVKLGDDRPIVLSLVPPGGALVCRIARYIVCLLYPTPSPRD